MRAFSWIRVLDGFKETIEVHVKVVSLTMWEEKTEAVRPSPICRKRRDGRLI